MDVEVILVSLMTITLAVSSCGASGALSPLDNSEIYGVALPINPGKMNTIKYTFRNISKSSISAMLKTYYISDNGKETEIETNQLKSYGPYSETDFTFFLSGGYSKDVTNISIRAQRTTTLVINKANLSLLSADRDEFGESLIIEPNNCDNAFEGKKNYVSFSSNNETQYYCGDKFYFNDFSEFVTAPYYWRIDLSNMSILYVNDIIDHEFTYKDAYFEIEDFIDNNFYNNVSTLYIDGYRRFPALLSLSKSDRGTLINIRPKDTLFVNPYTLKMSNFSSSSNDVETNYFYFPKMAYNSERICNFRLVIESCTYNSYTIKHDFTYQTDKAFIGSSNDAGFSISTDVNYGFNEYGRTVSL